MLTWKFLPENFANPQIPITQWHLTCWNEGGKWVSSVHLVENVGKHDGTRVALGRRGTWLCFSGPSPIRCLTLGKPLTSSEVQLGFLHSASRAGLPALGERAGEKGRRGSFCLSVGVRMSKNEWQSPVAQRATMKWGVLWGSWALKHAPRWGGGWGWNRQNIKDHDVC